MGKFAENRHDLDIMPDALEFVPPVVEDLSDDHEDKMDLDSGKDFQAR